VGRPGAGGGAFTFALAELLGPGAQITAVGRDGRAMRGLVDETGKKYPGVAIDVTVADFTRPLELRGLDGVVMANSLHLLRDTGPVLDSVRAMLRPRGRLVGFEYGTTATPGCRIPSRMSGGKGWRPGRGSSGRAS